MMKGGLECSHVRGYDVCVLGIFGGTVQMMIRMKKRYAHYHACEAWRGCCVCALYAPWHMTGSVRKVKNLWLFFGLPESMCMICIIRLSTRLKYEQ